MRIAQLICRGSQGWVAHAIASLRRPNSRHPWARRFFPSNWSAQRPTGTWGADPLTPTDDERTTGAEALMSPQKEILALRPMLFALAFLGVHCASILGLSL